MNVFKKIWNYLFGKVKSLFTQVLDACLTKTKDLINDRQLMALALDAVKAAADEKLTGNKAFVKARNKLVASLKEAGIELKSSTINLAIELVYNGLKTTLDDVKQIVNEED